MQATRINEKENDHQCKLVLRLSSTTDHKLNFSVDYETKKAAPY
jgi:hypothetical protein